MPVKPMSDMTDQDFVRCIGALGLQQREIAYELGIVLGRRKPLGRATISNYATGRMRIPNEVALAVYTLCERKAQALKILAADRDTRVSNLIQFQNSFRPYRRRDQHPTADRFMNRQNAEGTSTKLLAPYRIRLKYYPVLVQALAGWHAHVMTLARQYTDAARQKDYQLEVADLKALAASLPRALPYEAHVTKAEWQVIGRALRHMGTNPAINLYQHWKRHKGCGYPVRRPAPANELSSRGEVA